MGARSDHIRTNFTRLAEAAQAEDAPSEVVELNDKAQEFLADTEGVVHPAWNRLKQYAVDNDIDEFLPGSNGQAARSRKGLTTRRRSEPMPVSVIGAGYQELATVAKRLSISLGSMSRDELEVAVQTALDERAEKVSA